MPGTTMNEYRVTFASGSEKLLVRVDSKEVTADAESAVDPIRQVQWTRGNIDVALPPSPQPVYCVVRVTPQAAEDADCIGAPNGFTVEAGTPVIFQAITGAGFLFDGWYVDAPLDPDNPPSPFDPDVPVAVTEIATFPMHQPAPGQTRTLTAQFRPVPAPPVSP